MSTITERLRAVEGSRPDVLGISTNWHRNPDGPEAADLIDDLVAALVNVLDSQGAMTKISEFPNCLNMTEEEGRNILALITRAKEDAA